jgi:hypothetical protein
MYTLTGSRQDLFLVCFPRLLRLGGGVPDHRMLYQVMVVGVRLVDWLVVCLDCGRRMRVEDRGPGCRDRGLEPRHDLSHLSRQQRYSFEESLDHDHIWGFWSPADLKILRRLLVVGFGLGKSIGISIWSPGVHDWLLPSTRTWPLDPRPWQSSGGFGHVR